MKTNFLTVLAALVFGHISATGMPHSKERRAENACPDPSLAETFFGAFSIIVTAHVFRTRASFVNADSNLPQNSDWQIQGAVFRAWKQPQIGTVPLYTLAEPSTDIILVNSTTGGPPVVPGFPDSEVLAYGFPTQTCGSVPLFGLSQPANTDHWYTTDATERTELINTFGWTDNGIITFVLPVD